MTVQGPDNTCYQRLGYHYHFSIVQALQNSKNFDYLLFNKSLLKVCNVDTATVQSRYFGFFNANFELTHVHLCHIFWFGNLYAKCLSKVNGRDIIVAYSLIILAYFSAGLSSFL